MATEKPLGLSSSGNETSSSSRFTEEEILAELQEMGYHMRPEQVKELKKELDALMDASDAKDKSTPGQAQSTPGSGAFLAKEKNYQSAISEANRQIGRLGLGATRVESEAGEKSTGYTEDEVREVIEKAESWTRILRDESRKMDRMISELRSESRREAGTSPMSEGNEATEASSDQRVKLSDLIDRDDLNVLEKKALKDLIQSLKKNLVLTEHYANTPDELQREVDRRLAEILLPKEELEAYMRLIERAANEDKLRQPTLRPVVYPVPGCLPYKSDPVKRFELYKKEWEKFGIPGENKRSALRWKVRSYMMRQDFPQQPK